MEQMTNIKMWTAGVPVEAEARQQLRNIAALPILAGHVAVMPDVHLGKGATVGSVIATRGAIIPAAVGVDIGCGMLAVQTSLKAEDLPESLTKLRHDIERAVPVGFTEHRDPVVTVGDNENGVQLFRKAKSLAETFATLKIIERLRPTGKKVWNQIGSLGGGNHFIELCLDQKSQVWIMLHSGSRGIGNKIGEVAISMAREKAQRHDRFLPDLNLAWLDEGTPEFDEYVAGLRWAQDYAAQNRDVMLHLVTGVMKAHFGDKFTTIAQVINCHHNYATIEEHFGSKMWVTRKGAVRAGAGEMGIIPGSMGAKSFIVRGRGNADSYCSCSHGAGRAMSRTKARKMFKASDLISQTQGVECRKDDGVVDEIPAAYKSIDAVMAAQTDLIEVAFTLKQVMCIKG
jgi:tRNA-splicing ligase RtcB (3'-phosphate/5'-hydroxy nucleic acid ligase)